MRIRALSVSGVGKFDKSVSVAGFGEGVNVLCESNEAGKSTLFRALRACLFERHSTTQRIVQDLACEGLSLPVVIRLAFEHGGKDYEIEKSFLKQRRASFREAGRELATNQEADEALWDVLGIRPGSGRAVDQAHFGLLWVSQGDSFRQAPVIGAAADALAGAIQAEVGSLVGGQRARVLLAEIRRDLSEFVTETTGRPRAGGPLHQAQTEAARLAAEVSEAERKLAAMESQIARLAQARRDLAAAADPADIRAMEMELRAAEAELKTASEARERLAQREPLLKARRSACDEAARRLREIAERADRIDQDRARLAGLDVALDEIDAGTAEQAARLAEAGAEAAAIGARELEQDAALSRIDALAAALADAALSPDLARRRDAIAEAGGRLSALDDALAGDRAPDHVAAELDRLDREIGATAAVVQAGAASVAVEVGPAGAGAVLVDGAPAEARHAVSATMPVVVVVGDLATITITPPAGGAAERARLASLEARRAALVAGAGFADGEALRLARQRRLALERDRAGVAGQLKGLGVDPARARAEADALDARLVALARRTTAALAAAGFETMPDAADLLASKAAIEDRRSADRQARGRIEGRREAANAALQRLSAEGGARRAELDALRGRLALDLGQLPDADRASAMEKAREALLAEQSALDAERAAIEAQRLAAPDEADLERKRIRTAGRRSAIERKRQEIVDKEREIAILETQVDAACGEGLGEGLARLRDDAAFWGRQADKHQRRVDALKALRDAVSACLDEQRERLHAPVKRHLKPYLEDVFGSADPDIGDGYGVEGLDRGAGRERLEHLSDGTREQIAVLTRLAMGSLLAERGEAVPILLDDALVYSDDARIERMFDALGRAGAQQQVIVFTCRSRAFQRLGGRRLTLTDAG